MPIDQGNRSVAECGSSSGDARFSTRFARSLLIGHLALDEFVDVRSRCESDSGVTAIDVDRDRIPAIPELPLATVLTVDVDSIENDAIAAFSRTFPSAKQHVHVEVSEDIERGTFSSDLYRTNRRLVEWRRARAGEVLVRADRSSYPSSRLEIELGKGIHCDSLLLSGL